MKAANEWSPAAFHVKRSLDTTADPVYTPMRGQGITNQGDEMMAILGVKLFKGRGLTDYFMALTPSPDHQWTEIRVSVHDSEISISDGLALYEMIKAFPAEKKSAHIYGVCSAGAYAACLAGRITMSRSAILQFETEDNGDRARLVMSASDARGIPIDEVGHTMIPGAAVRHSGTSALNFGRKIGLVDAIGYPSEEETKT